MREGEKEEGIEGEEGREREGVWCIRKGKIERKSESRARKECRRMMGTFAILNPKPPRTLDRIPRRTSTSSLKFVTLR